MTAPRDSPGDSSDTSGNSQVQFQIHLQFDHHQVYCLSIAKSRNRVSCRSRRRRRTSFNYYRHESCAQGCCAQGCCVQYFARLLLDIKVKESVTLRSSGKRRSKQECLPQKGIVCVKNDSLASAKYPHFSSTARVADPLQGVVLGSNHGSNVTKCQSFFSPSFFN